MKKKATKRKKLPSLKSLHAKAWKLWSVYIRTKDADWRGYNRCYTCKKYFHWKELQAGHYWHGRLDFDSRNLKPQCSRCNKWLSGNLDNYTMYLIEDMGLEAVKQLRRDAAQHKGYSRQELLDIISKYT
jgi:hypothetical protein